MKALKTLMNERKWKNLMTVTSATQVQIQLQKWKYDSSTF